MWKVRNKKNELVLGEFEREVVHPLWALITADRSEGFSMKEALSFSGARSPRALLKLRFGGRSLLDALNEVRTSMPLHERREMKTLYDSQNADLRAGSRPEYAHVPATLAQIFGKFLYEKALVNAAVWSSWGHQGFTRAQFHDNFRNDNPHVPACPYCDLDTLNSLANSSVEHFLPRSKFPFLSLNAFNLVPSCNACNSSWEGKGVKVIRAATSPFELQIGDAVRFTFEVTKRSVGMRSLGDVAGVTEYLDLLGLAARYGRGQVFDSVATAGGAIFESLVREDYTAREITEYLRAVRSGAPLLFALTAYVQEMRSYLQSAS